MKRIIYLLITIGVMPLISFFSCRKFVQIPPPKSQLVTSTVFADSVGANAALNGIYINMMQYFNFSFTNGGITLYTGLTGDEMLEAGDNNADDLEFYNNAISVSNSVNQQLWPQAYQIIYDANACITALQESTNITSSTKNAMIAEAMFIRSFIYFNLVNLYGPVPLITGIDYNVNRLVSRSAVNVVYSQMVSDLQFAQDNLPKTGAIRHRRDDPKKQGEDQIQLLPLFN